MNPFVKHPQQQGINYREHLEFAMGIACRLSCVVIAFSVHAVFPFIGISRSLDLEATAGFILERNKWIESAKLENQPESISSHPEFEVGGIFASNV